MNGRLVAIFSSVSYTVLGCSQPVLILTQIWAERVNAEHFTYKDLQIMWTVWAIWFIFMLCICQFRVNSFQVVQQKLLHFAFLFSPIFLTMTSMHWYEKTKEFYFTITHLRLGYTDV